MTFQKGNKLWKNKKNWPDFSGAKNPFHGKKHSKESKAKRLISLGNHLAGPNHPLWKNDKTLRYWRRMVLKRDNYTCMICNLYDPEIVEADHIKSKKVYPELSNKVENGMTMCPNCHRRKTVRDKELKAMRVENTKKQWLRQRAHE